jgi:hypothetical protein
MIPALVAGDRPNSMKIGADEPRPLELLYTLPVLDRTFPSPGFPPRPEGLGAMPLIRESGGESPSNTH